MVPSLIETLADLPRLPSGKLNRAALPAPRIRKKRLSVALRTESERRLLKVWTALFQPLDVSLNDDFFLDLGGHSLLAARMVSEMRNDPRFASLTMRDVYNHPTISQLASAADSFVPIESPPAPSPQHDDRHARSRHFLAGVIQSASLYLVFAFRGFHWIAPYLIYFMLAARHSMLESAAWAAASGIALLPVLILIAVGVKWALLGRVRPGRYPLWGWYYLRWWFVQTLIRSVPLARLGGTPLLPFVYRLFGAKVATNIHIATDLLAAFDVISIGDGASVDEGASLLGYTVEDGHLAIGPVSVGCRGFVGTRSVLSPNTVMEDGARLEDLSLLQSGTHVPAGQTWAGSPPRRIFLTASEPDPPPAPGMFGRTVRIALYVALACTLPLVELFAFVPGVAILIHFNAAQMLFYLAAPLVGASFIVCLTALVVLLKWFLIGRARAGRYAVHGGFYVRNWLVEQLLALSVDIAGPLHATLFLKPWYRALGVRLGRFVEISNASVTTPDLLAIGDDCTVADEVSLGAARVEGGWLTLAPTKLGRRVFVGNSAVIPAGTALADESLVGVLTIAPSDSGQTARPGAGWLGSPPIFLPRRQPGAAFPEQRTFRPDRRFQCTRGCFEIFRVTLPGAGFVMVTVAVVDAASKLWGHWGPVTTLVLLPAVFAACCAAVILIVAAAKWIAIGRYRPFEQPFWSAFVWRLEFVNALFEFLATPIGLEALRGTPLLPWYLQLLGARIGRRVYIDSTGFLEFDLVKIGDRSVLNKDCILQTHLFEDRVLKASGLRIGVACEIGTQSVVLYDAEMKDGARLGPLSLLMKGEVLPTGKVWEGSPSGPTANTIPDTNLQNSKAFG
jgi:non-ribosomal peptide synthetase-like protein